MKQSKVADLLSALEKRKGGDIPVFNKIRFKSLPGFAETEIEPKSSFVAFCGGTGTGKSALLELFGTTLSKRIQDLNRRVERLGTCNISLDISLAGNSSELSLTFPPDLGRAEYSNEVLLIDASLRTSRCIDFFTKQNKESLLDGVGFYKLPEATVSAIGYVCRRDYDEISVAEVEDGDEIIPFFRVVTGAYHYDSLSSSAGELSTFYLAWALFSAPESTVALIEEPEAFLPPVGQRAMSHLLAKAAVERKLAVMITTHSAEMITDIPHRFVFPIKRTSNQSTIPVSRQSKRRTLSSLGLRPPVMGVLFVEDEAAKDVLEEILSATEVPYHLDIELSIPGKGAGDVKRALDGLPSDSSKVLYLGVLDGDMESSAKKWKVSNNLIFLPFKKSIEIEFVSAISAEMEEAARVFGRTLDQVEDALEDVRGMDPHDKVDGISKALRLSNRTFRIGAFKIWRSVGSNEKGISEFEAALISRLRSSTE